MADWPSALIAAGAALSGVGLSQWSSAQQAKARAAREDAARSWDHRRAAYVAFRQGMVRLYDHMERASYDREAEPLEMVYDWVYGLLADVDFFGAPAVRAAGRDALERSIEAREAEPQQPVQARWLREFVDAARKDLGVPD